MAKPCSAKAFLHRRSIFRPSRQGGQSLAEVMVAVVILSFVVFGAAAFMQASSTMVDKAMLLRTATQVAQDRLERTKATAYASLAVGTTTGSTTISGQVYNWSMAVSTAQADPGDTNSVYKLLACTATCAGTNQSVSVRCAVAP